MTTELTYKCDNDSCGKVQSLHEADKTFRVITVRHISSNSRIRDSSEAHACSNACERSILLEYAKAPCSFEQLESEVRAAWPDLAKRLDDQEAAHAQEIGAARTEIARLKATIDGMRNAIDRRADRVIGIVERLRNMVLPW